MIRAMISVCMATYNGERFIHDQIQSILIQLGEDDEIVISDDGSSDSTDEIVSRFNDPRIRFIRNTGRRGVNFNFENALIHSRGEYIFLSDQDDVWIDGKVEECVKALRDSACVVHDVVITDENLNPIKESFFKSRGCASGFIHNWIHNGYLGCAMAFRREVLDWVLPIPAGFPAWHDIWIGAVSELKFKVRFLPMKGGYFRRHSNTTSITGISRLPVHKMVTSRLGLLFYLLLRSMRGRRPILS